MSTTPDTYKAFEAWVTSTKPWWVTDLSRYEGERYRAEETWKAFEAFAAGRASLAATAAPVAPLASEPMFWVRLCSDGMYEGPIHNAQIEKVRQQSGAWHPLYLAAPPAPAPQPEPVNAQMPADEDLYLVHAGGDSYQAAIVPASRLDDAYLLTQWGTLADIDPDQRRDALEHFHDDDQWTHEEPTGRGARVKFSVSFEDGWVEVVRLPRAAIAAAEAAQAEPAPDIGNRLAEQVHDARTRVAAWSPAKRASVQLEGAGWQSAAEPAPQPEPAQPATGERAPSLQAAHEMGAKGAPPNEPERLAFEAWMRGHCWALCATWTGTEYRSDAEQGGWPDPQAMRTRQLWAAWRDRAALAAQPAAPVQAVPSGFALVPLRMTPEMLDVVDGEWDWPDLLAAAEAITEQQYAELQKVQAVPLTDEQIDACIPAADGTAEVNVTRLEVLPGVMGTEYEEADAWSLPLVKQIIRAVERAHGITKESSNANT